VTATAVAAVRAVGRVAGRLTAGILVVLVAATAAPADHPGPFRSAGSPILEALMWAGAAFLVGIAIVAIVAVLARKRTPSE
jgi:hypothetical protein